MSTKFIFLPLEMCHFFLEVTCQWLNMFQYTSHTSDEHGKREVVLSTTS